MDRALVYPGQIPLDDDLLRTNRNAMIAVAKLAEAVLGSSTIAHGLACTPTAPASMQVAVGPGEIYSLQNIDATAYGSLLADTTHQVLKQGVRLDSSNLSCPAPGTSGQSINYLIQAAFSETDTDATVLLYYNASDPTQAWSGPNNSGDPSNRTRKDTCVVSVKAGTAATTGSQTTPAADAGYVGLWVVTVANGQTSITSGSITAASGQPLLTEYLAEKIGLTTGDARYAKKADVQNGSLTYASATGTNTKTASLTPAPSALVAGMSVRIANATANTGATTLNLNGLGAVAIQYGGAALSGGELAASQIYTLTYDGSVWQMTSPKSTGAPGAMTGLIGEFMASAAPAGWLACDGSNVSRTTYADLWAWVQAYGVVAADSTDHTNNPGKWYTGNGTTTFTLPDLRDDFRRGASATNTVGVHQAGAVEAHTHSAGFIDPEGRSDGSIPDLVPTNAGGFTAFTTGSTGGTETKPRNTPTLVCVKT